MKVHWTATAERHLDRIHDYIALDSTLYARRTIARIIRRSQQIAEFPLSGRKVPEYDRENVREIIEGQYRIIYLLNSGQIDVLLLSMELCKSRLVMNYDSYL